jgi:hypothetical protein
MHYSDMIRYSSGLLQFGVAFYALRLGRLFSTARVGWLLFSALSILAVANLLLPLNPFRGSLQMGVKVDIIYALVSSLLIATMAHFDVRFRKQVQSMNSERESQSQWEGQAQRRFEAASKNNEELRAIASKLQAEIAQQKQAQEQAESAHQEQLSALRLTEEELRQTIARLEAGIADQKRVQDDARVQAEQAQQEQVAAAHQAGMNAGIAETATRMFDNLGVLASHATAASLAVDDLSKARMAPITRIARLLNESARDVSHFTKAQPRLRQFPDRLVQLAQQLSEEQIQHLKKLDSVKRKLALANEAVHQSHNEVAGILGLEVAASPTEELASLRLGEPAPSSAHLQDALEQTAEPPRTDGVGKLQEHLINNVTQTGTELPAQDAVSTPQETAAPALADPAETAAAVQIPAQTWPLPTLKLKMAAATQPDLGGKSA